MKQVRPDYFILHIYFLPKTFEPNAHVCLARIDITLLKRILSGALSGMIGSALATPTDLVKIRYQSHKIVPYTSTIEAYVEIMKADGIKGLYSGLAPTVVRASVLTAAQMSSYDQTKRYLLMNNIVSKDGFKAHLASAFVSGLVTSIVTSPVDFVKTRVMSDKSKLYRGSIGNDEFYCMLSNYVLCPDCNESKYLDCIKKSYRADGLFVFYRGYLGNYLRLG